MDRYIYANHTNTHTQISKRDVLANRHLLKSQAILYVLPRCVIVCASTIRLDVCFVFVCVDVYVTA